MNKTLNTWLNTMWRAGAIDVGQRDDLKYRLNIACEDYEAIAADMGKYARYMSAAYQSKWTALVAANFPRVECIPMNGTDYHTFGEC